MTVFRAVSPDVPEARDLLTEYFSFRAAEFPDSAYTVNFPDPALFLPPRGVFLLLGADGEAQGCGGIRRIDDSEAGIRYEVKHLFVRPTARGTGAGRALLSELEVRARTAGARELVLDTHHTLEAANTLYQRHGFESVDAYNDNPNATRWYRKIL